MRSRAIPYLSLVLLLGSVAPSAAQRVEAEVRAEAELSPEAARAAAREAYAEGQRLYREGQHAEAEASFSRAYAMIPNPVVLLGIAEARQAQGNISGSVQALETYLRERPDAPDAAEIRGRLEQMRSTNATLVIASNPPGATILLDGEDTGKVTPAELDVEPGPHVVALRLEGRQDVEAQVDAGYGSRPELNLQMAEAVPQSGGLDGDGNPVDGAGLGDPDDADEDDSGPGTAVWVLSGVAAASLVAGTVLGFLALTEESEFEDMPTDATADRGERFAVFADVAFGLAAVSAISAIIVFATSGDDDDEEDADEVSAQFYPVASPTGAGLVGQVQF